MLIKCSLLAFIVAGPLFAADIRWDKPQDISGPSDVSTEGFYYGAWSPANATIPVGTVNGVQMRGDDLELTTSGFDGSGAAFGTHATANATYNSLLQHGAWSNGKEASFTINGTKRRPLTPGRQYLIQLWVSDGRPSGVGRAQTVSGSAPLAFQTASQMGRYVIGRFTADAASQTVAISATISAQVNLVQLRDITPREKETRHERWRRLKYGIFSHYTYAATGNADRSAERFNAEAYANDVAKAGAEYVVWTAWHSSTVPMFWSVSCPKYSWGGSQRDAVSAMIDAVRAKGIRVFLYVHPFQPVTSPNNRHNDMINELFAEVVDRYGPRIDGLWIDENQVHCDQDAVVDYNRLIETIKSRNPDLVLMQNGAQMYTIDRAGPETVGDWNYARWECMYNLAAPWISITPEDMFRTTVINAAGNYDGGGVHWSIDGVPDGGLGETRRIFKCGEYLAPIRASVCGTKPSASFPPPYTGSQLRYGVVRQWVATEALDDSKVYIHVMKPPAGPTITLPLPVDGKIFRSARLLANGNAVRMTQNPYDGVGLTLAGTDKWDPLDTVIELTVGSKGGAGHVNDTSRKVAYAGKSWGYQKNRRCGEFADDIHYATADGDSFTFTFTGTDVEYIASRGAKHGRVAIYIDGVPDATVDLATGTPGCRQVVYGKSGLRRGRHTLKAVKQSGLFMDVDCFKVTDLVNDSDPEMAGAFKNTVGGGVTYGGRSNWWQPGAGGTITPATVYYPDKKPLTDPLKNEPDSDWFECTFDGTGIEIPLVCAFSWGYFYVKVDGVYHRNIEVWVNTPTSLSITGLAPGKHTVKCIAWRATTDQAQPGHGAITVTRPGIWQAASGRGYGEIGDDVHYTDTNGGQFSYTFDGSGVEAITTRDRDGRMAWFGVTGPEVNIQARLQNFWRRRQARTSVFSLPHLRPGMHTLNISHAANTSGQGFSFARLTVDAVRIYKGEPLPVPALNWGAAGNGGSGIWDMNGTANWHNGASMVKWPAVRTVDEAAIFGGAAGTVQLSGAVGANRLHFNTTGYRLQNGTLVLSGASPTIATSSGVSAMIASNVAGAAGLTKTGEGSLTLSSAVIYTGTTTVANGVLSLQNDYAGAAFRIEAGGVLDFTVAAGIRDGRPATFTGHGTLRKSGKGQMGWGRGAAAFKLGSGGLIDVQEGIWCGGKNPSENWTANLADLNIAAGAVFSGGGAKARVDVLSGAGTLKSGGNGAGYSAFTFGVDNGSGTFSGTLADDTTSGNFIKIGSGTQTLAGANTHTGITTVTGGTLLVDGSLSKQSAVRVASGCTLGGSGKVGGVVTVQKGGRLAPGSNGAGTLTVGSAALAGHLSIQVGGESVDCLAAESNLDISSCTLEISPLAGGLTRRKYVLATYGRLTGNAFAAVTGLPSGYQIRIDAENRRILLVGN